MIFTSVLGIQKGFSSFLYVMMILAILIIGLTIFFIMRLKPSLKDFLKVVGISASITIGIELFLFVISRFLPSLVYSIGQGDFAATNIYLIGILYLFIPIFLLVLFIYYLIKFLRRR